MQTFQVIVYTPPGLPNPSLAIAASRAGSLGVLNLEYTRDKQAAITAIEKLARYARNEFGVKLDSYASKFLTEVISKPPKQLATVILTYSDDQILKRQVQVLHRRKLRVLLEATCLKQAQLGEQLGVDGVIAKGHETGGRIGEETSFILLQQFLIDLKLPVWAHGGMGLHTTAACHAAGAAGVVLDFQLALCRESAFPESVRSRIAIMDGSETICLGSDLGETYRVYARPGIPVVNELRQVEKKLTNEKRPRAKIIASWRQAILERVGWDSPEHDLLLFGQDAAFAAPLAKRFGTVAAVLEGIKEEIDSHYQSARKLRPLDEGSPLAQSHGTRYPIVQGPMARISDRPAFALAVAEGGGLPFMALSLMSPSELGNLLEETKRLLGDRPWGVGIIGFLPPDLLQQQMEVIRDRHPPYALIAGGRPNQDRALVEAGIPTYMHVASPGLLKIFLRSGTRRFIFEGRESGGHVGPFCSFVLWEPMIDELLGHLSEDKDASECHVLFAGGIHDALSASMVAVMAAPLAERGVRVGVQMGTAYLFTEELVESGGIAKTYQQEVLNCDQTVVLEVGPGHANRCIYTPFAEAFQEEKRRLKLEGKPAEEIRLALDQMCIGRLHLASKGISMESTGEANAPRIVTLSEEEQHARGMYMTGQVGAIRNRVCTIDALHHDVSVESSRRLETVAKAHPEFTSLVVEQEPSDIAIIGMACVMPKASDLQAYWENIINKVDAITEVPKERWDWKLYYDQDPKARDKVYSKWGGFLDDITFDPAEYGMPPSSLSSIEPLQLLTLEVVKRALIDAGYYKRPFKRERTSVILGAGGGAGDLGQRYGLRSNFPTLFGNKSSEILSHFDSVLPEWTEDSFAGILMNVAAGRVANRFDLGGVNYVVDAACASSLAAVHLAVKELETRSSDTVIVGGIDTMQNPFAYLCFSKTLALSPTGKAHTFDESADGIVLGEGVAVVILKRLADAERDGDRIYAVIKGSGFSSDGKAKGLTAPRLEGQILAMKRAYQKAKIPPATVGLIEAHGTGTLVGDKVEIQALSQVFNDAQTSRKNCAIGSVKSMIGHTKSTAGVAGLIKAALALHHKVLPPTLGVSKPNIKVNSSENPFYVNTETRPWLNSVNEHPRRAGVSAFGFGGTNFHAVLEEYTDDYLKKETEKDSVFQQWPSELFLFSGNSRQEILKAIEPIEEALSQGAKPKLRDLSYTLSKLAEQKAPSEGQAETRSYLRLAIVATSLDDLQRKLAWTREMLTASGTKSSVNNPQINDPRGIYFSEQPLGREGKIAFLFPGQGSQYINMLKDLTIQFPEVRTCFERADRTLQRQLSKPLSSYIFPPPVFNEEEENASKQALTQTNVSQPAVGAADMAMFHLLKELGVHPNFVAGHSYGEHVALCAAGVFNEDVLIAISEARGRFIVEAAGEEPSTMAAVDAGEQAVSEVLAQIKDVKIANLNAPKQTVITGATAKVQEAVERFKAQGIRARLIPVSCAFHSPIVAPARENLARFLENVEFAEPQLEVFSNTTASSYPREPKAIAGLLIKHLASPVKFMQEIEALYEAGARIFVEVGPRNILTALTEQILRDRPCLIVPSDQAGKAGLLQLHHLLAQLAAHVVPIKLSRLYQGREVRRLDLNTLGKETAQEKPPKTAWLVNGSRAIPLSGVSTPHPGQVEPLRVVVAGDALTFEHAVPPIKSQQVQTAAQFDLPVLEPDRRKAEPSAVPFSKDENARVMAQFQQTMNHFLDTQKNVMMAYLKAASQAQDSYNLAQDLASATSSKSIFPEPQPKQAQSPVARAKEEPSLTLSESPQKLEIPSKEELTSRLLQIVGERTGYPLEMLDLDLDLEADLGIDSIKRIEIMASFRENYAWKDEQNMTQAMEELASLKTLRGIIDWMENRLKSTREGKEIELKTKESISDSQARQIAVPESLEEDTIQRFTLTAVEVPLRGELKPLALNKVFVLTDDENGVARALAEELKARGHAVALVRMGKDFGFQISDFGFYTSDLTSPGAVEQLLDVIRQQQGPIGGLVHLLPLKNGMTLEEMDLKSWKELLRLEVKSLFYLAKNLRQDFKQAGQDGGACLVAATKMGGGFASVPQSGLAGKAEQFFPGQGGVTGLLKTIAIEWPDVRVRAVDLHSPEPSATLASKLLQEITAEDGQVEIGYPGSQRIVLQPALAPVDKEGQTTLEIDPSWVILVTGGAQGITADVACELAKRYQPTLLLVGRSPLPESEEADETARLEGKELKAVLMARMRREGQPVTPAQLKTAYTRLLKDREMRSNIAAMRSYGAKLQYYQADVRDEEAFGNLIEKIYQSYGRLDGVIHGAGIIEDKLVRDKTPESFDRVFDTKVDSALILSRKLRPDSLKFLVFFSSVAGRFGNRGQCDYAAANEVYNKLAIYLDSHWPGRVVSVIWSPWARTGGMTSPELQKQFAKAGVVLIPRSVGPRKLDEELRYGGKGEAEVIIGGNKMRKGQEEAGKLFSPGERADKEKSYPLISKASVLRGAADSVEIVRYLDPARDLYLRDHKLDGKPVFPMVMAMELMAELVSLAWPGFELAVLKNMQVLHGIVIEHGSKPIRVVAKPRAGSSTEQIEVELSISGMENPGRIHYQAMAELAKQLPTLTEFEPLSLAEARPFSTSVSESYRQWLFHGPLFQKIAQIEKIGSNGITASLIPSSPEHCVAEAKQGHWLIDPMIIDSGLQLVLIWARSHWDMSLLPSRFWAYRRFGSLSHPKIDCQAHILPNSKNPVIHANIAFLGAGGRLLGLLEDMEGTGSKSLNRLAGSNLRERVQ